ncbi:MAG: N-acetyltransferase [Pseudomonadota bacterium]
MIFTDIVKSRHDEVVALFHSSFSESEGLAEGDLIGALVRALLTTTPNEDIFAFLALDADKILGAIIFSRLRYPDDARTVFLLSPVAVLSSYQGEGVGQNLINHGLQKLEAQGVDVVITYGDVKFYSKVGFIQITQEIAKAPLPLQYPEGWLGQSLSKSDLAPIAGPSYCASALNNPVYW